MASKWFKNTFAPNVRTKIVNAEQVILLLFHRVVLFKDLPQDVQAEVSILMKKKTQSSSNNSTVEDK